MGLRDATSGSHRETVLRFHVVVNAHIGLVLRHAPAVDDVALRRQLCQRFLAASSFVTTWHTYGAITEADEANESEEEAEEDNTEEKKGDDPMADFMSGMLQSLSKELPVRYARRLCVTFISDVRVHVCTGQTACYGTCGVGCAGRRSSGRRS